MLLCKIVQVAHLHVDTRGTTMMRGSTRGSPGVNRVTTLLLLSVFGIDPLQSTDWFKGAEQFRKRGDPDPLQGERLGRAVTTPGEVKQHHVHVHRVRIHTLTHTWWSVPKGGRLAALRACSAARTAAATSQQQPTRPTSFPAHQHQHDTRERERWGYDLALFASPLLACRVATTYVLADGGCGVRH